MRLETEESVDRIKTSIDNLVKQYHHLIDQNASWSDQKFCLGKIEGLRLALMLLSDPNSVIPSELVA